MSDSDYPDLTPSGKRYIEGESQPPPARAWLWFLLGILVTIGSLFLALTIIDYYITRDPLILQSEQPPASDEPIIIRLTAPPTAIPSATPFNPTPTAIPTLTPSPTPDRLVAPFQITVGFFARVANTDGFGVNVRQGAGTANELLVVADEDSPVYILDGPINLDGFTWWQIQLEDGQIGWVVQRFLEPAGQPENWTFTSSE